VAPGEASESYAELGRNSPQQRHLTEGADAAGGHVRTATVGCPFRHGTGTSPKSEVAPSGPMLPFVTRPDTS
jgi:hypothetical protein